jgi:RNA polymerase sigma-70 factor (ECF subfamily)
MRYNLPSVVDVDAILGETMTAIVESIMHFDGSISLRTFVYSIAAHKVADFYRHRQYTGQLAISKTTQPVLFGTEAGARTAPNLHAESFYEILSQLPDQSRQAMLLRYRIGLSVDEIALILGQSYNATCSLLRQGQNQFEYAGVSVQSEL